MSFPIKHDSRFNYIGMNNNTAQVCFFNNEQQTIETVIEDGIVKGILTTVKLPTKISGNISLYTYSASKFNDLIGLDNEVGTKLEVVSEGDYFIDKGRGEITLISKSNMTLAVIYEFQHSSVLKRIQDEANDKVETYAYFDVGTDDERISSITYSSAELGLAITEIFNYTGTPGNYTIISSTLSIGN